MKGNEIKSAFGDVKQGPWLKKAVDMVAEWQFNEIETPTKEQAIEMLQNRKHELGLT